MRETRFRLWCPNSFILRYTFSCVLEALVCIYPTLGAPVWRSTRRMRPSLVHSGYGSSDVVHGAHASPLICH
ncbi:hypothetical protein C8R44DRAFT_973507 [Mycena epipterygia]|nr:hypothetical protein C8R44DRAFT_973507 [Mycena epipterygia]